MAFIVRQYRSRADGDGRPLFNAMDRKGALLLSTGLSIIGGFPASGSNVWPGQS